MKHFTSLRIGQMTVYSPVMKRESVWPVVLAIIFMLAAMAIAGTSDFQYYSTL